MKSLIFRLRYYYGLWKWERKHGKFGKPEFRMSKELLALNVNEHTEKKGQLTYLSWAWAWAEVLKIDPKATWMPVLYGDGGKPQPCMWIGDTAMVHTVVTINGVSRDCFLPVMDHKNNAVKNPDSRKISDAIMRCMTKAISMHGLGLYIYAGEDLPQAEAELTPEEIEAQKKREARGKELDQLADYMLECHSNGKDLDAIKVWYEPTTFSEDIAEANEERLYVWGLLKVASKLRSAIKANKPDAWAN